MRYLATLVLLLLWVSMLISCSDSSLSSNQMTTEGSWERRAWIDKAARALHAGSPGLSLEEIKALDSLPKDDIVDRLMDDVRFDATVLDFNRFFLGIKSKDEGSFSAYSQSALASAFEQADQGDYFSIFDGSLSYLLTTGLTSPNRDGGRPDLVTPEELRAHWIQLAKEEATAWLSTLQSIPDEEELCAYYNNNSNEVTFLLQRIGLSFEFFFQLQDQKASFFCSLVGNNSKVKGQAKSFVLDEARGLLQAALKIEALIPRLIKPTLGLRDLIKIPVADLPLSKDSIDSMSYLMWLELPNSSTNFNRKRAAYFLKTFFCDDLTPLNVVLPAVHAEDKHASAPACQSCHYKLDPMAGFFRNLSVLGYDVSAYEILLHDDGVVRTGEALQAYQKTWQAPEGSGRRWDVGFIRSSTQSRLNDYGSELSDLFQIIRAAPESKRCLTKRMASYVLGTEQVYDGRWLDSMTQEFLNAGRPDAAREDSSRAFKKVMKTLVLSQTFATQDPVQGQCYDHAPDAPASSLPCEVAAIIEKNCVSCHTGAGAAKGLDLTNWKPISAQEEGFVHIDVATGRQLSRVESFARISCSLSPQAGCREARMPLNKDMDNLERASLYNWLQKTSAGDLR